MFDQPRPPDAGVDDEVAAKLHNQKVKRELDEGDETQVLSPFSFYGGTGVPPVEPAQDARATPSRLTRLDACVNNHCIPL